MKKITFNKKIEPCDKCGGKLKKVRIEDEQFLMYVCLDCGLTKRVSKNV